MADIVAWSRRDEIIANMLAEIIDEFPSVESYFNHPNIGPRLTAVLDGLELGYARKKTMILHRMLQAAESGTYGDIGTVGNRTDLGTFLEDMRKTYHPAFLDNFDEDGNLL